MKNAWLAVRSAILWAVSGIHFVAVIPLLIGMAMFIDPRKNDYPQRLFFRNILRLLGIRFRVRRAPGFDPERTSLFICNHVNIFDPFVVYTANSAVPARLRAGLSFQNSLLRVVDGAVRKYSRAERHQPRRAWK